MSNPAKTLEDALADALRKTRDCLSGWMEIQDEEDAREYDHEAVAEANAALSAYEARQSAETGTAALVQQLRDKGHVVVVWSVADVPEGVADDPQAWLADHATDIANASVAAGNEVIGYHTMMASRESTGPQP
ncbi:MAG: hypothetical protein ACREPQ_00575 [Rhodanobacter sp.]